MDQKWFDQQTTELGEALAEQGLSLAVPIMLPDQFKPYAGEEVASLIDHTALKVDVNSMDIKKLCAEAREYGFAAVCVNPRYVSLAAELLTGSTVAVCAVVGFPLGATTTLTKVVETRDAVANGASEIDMVISVGALKEGEYSTVYNDILAVRSAAYGKLLKVILETGSLTKEEIVRGCILSKMAKADFVKTSTGFGPGGATAEDISLMRKVVGPELGVKASGGVRDRKTALQMIQAGATRIGTSSGVAIVSGMQGGSGY